MAMKKLESKCDYHTPSGKPVAPVYEEVFDEDLKIMFVKQTKEFDLDEFIQASNSKTDLALLRQQMLETGQIPIIDDEVDQTAALMPSNIHELYDIVNSVDNVYNKLPESIKSAFKDKDDFLTSLVSGTYQQRIAKHVEDVVAAAAKTDKTGSDPVEGDK